MENIHAGNTYQDGPERRGWFVGNFMPEDDLRQSHDVEIKWGQHQAGEAREEWVRGEERSTVLVLVSGIFTIVFPEGEHTLKEQGDYLMWGPGVDHSWRADEDAVTMTVRWTSTK